MRKTLLSAFAALASLSLMAQPTTLPVDPPARDASQVISFYGDAYTNVEGINYNPGWGQSTQVNAAFAVEGSTVLRYAGLNYQGTEFADQSAVDMTHIHIDIWSNKTFNLDLYPIWRGSTAATEVSKKLSLVANQWNSFDIPLTDFAGVDFSAIYQFKIQDHGGNVSDIYITNWYFYTDDVIADEDAPTNFTAVAGTITKDNIELVLNADDNYNSLIYTIKYDDVTIPVTAQAGVQRRYVVDVLEPNTEYTFEVTVADAAGNVNATTIPVTAKTLADPLARPTTLAPIPTVPAENVISIIGATYGNYNLNYKIWDGGPTTHSVIKIAGVSLDRFENFGLQGIEFVGAGGALNLTGMENLHIDVWTPNETSFGLAVGGDGANTVSCSPLLQGQWNSYDIPVTSLGIPAITDVQVMSFNSGTGKTVYVDNVYFYKGTQSINAPVVDKEEIARQYFTIDGRAVSVPTFGMFIVKKIYVDGSVEIEKILVK